MRKLIPVLLVLLSLSCASKPTNQRFCNEVERLGWFDDPTMRALSRSGWFAPDPFYPANPRNPYFRPTPIPSVNCFCYSKARNETLASCPVDPWTPRGEPVPRWHLKALANRGW